MDHHHCQCHRYPDLRDMGDFYYEDDGDGIEPRDDLVVVLDLGDDQVVVLDLDHPDYGRG